MKTQGDKRQLSSSQELTTWKTPAAFLSVLWWPGDSLRNEWIWDGSISKAKSVFAYVIFTLLMKEKFLPRITGMIEHKTPDTGWMRSQQFINHMVKAGVKGEENTACHLEGFTRGKNEKAGGRGRAGFVFGRRWGNSWKDVILVLIILQAGRELKPVIAGISKHCDKENWLARGLYPQRRVVKGRLWLAIQSPPSFRYNIRERGRERKRK